MIRASDVWSFYVLRFMFLFYAMRLATSFIWHICFVFVYFISINVFMCNVDLYIPCFEVAAKEVG